MSQDNSRGYSCFAWFEEQERQEAKMWHWCATHNVDDKGTVTPRYVGTALAKWKEDYQTDERQTGTHKEGSST